MFGEFGLRAIASAGWRTGVFNSVASRFGITDPPLANSGPHYKHAPNEQRLVCVNIGICSASVYTEQATRSPLDNDAELVVRARYGDLQGFDRLMRRHYDAVRRIALRFAAISEEADDLTQETFVTAYERLDQLVQPDRFAAWIAAIAKNEGLMWKRRRAGQPSLLSLDGDDSDTDSTLGTAIAESARESAHRRAIRETVSSAVSALTAEQRMAVRLHYIEGYNYGETAALLDIPVAAVRGRLERARNVLRKELQEMSTHRTREYKLSSRDLDAIRAAANCAHVNRPDHDQRPLIESLYFTGHGSLVSTDTYRLFHYSSGSLSDIPQTLVHADLGRALRDQHPDAHNARLTLVDGRAVLLLDNGDDVSAPLVEGQFPDWEKIFPADWRINATAPAGDWLDSLAQLARQRGQVQTALDRRMLIILSAEERRIILRQGKEPTDGQRISWEASVSFPAEVQTTFGCAVNCEYLEQALQGLGLPPDGAVALYANDPEKSLLLRPADSESVWTMLMPMQICPHPPEAVAAGAQG